MGLNELALENERGNRSQSTKYSKDQIKEAGKTPKPAKQNLNA